MDERTRRQGQQEEADTEKPKQAFILGFAEKRIGALDVTTSGTWDSPDCHDNS